MAEEDDDRECNRAFRRCILMVEFIIVQVLIKSDLWFPLVRLCQEYMSTASTGTFVLCNGYGNVKAVHIRSWMDFKLSNARDERCKFQIK